MENESPIQPTTAESPVAVVQRSTFNYVVIALVFLVIGVVIGAVGFERITQQDRLDTEALINRAVSTAVASVPVGTGSGSAAAEDQPLNISIDGDPFLGPEDAPIVIVEFGDFRCSFCRRFHNETFDPLLTQYEGRIRYVFRDHPTLTDESFPSALAAECAHDQGAFWEFRDLLFAAASPVTRETFIQFATDTGLDVDQFAECYDNQTPRDEIVQDFVDAQSAGVTGTPTFFINGTPLIGAQPIERFQLAIDAALAQVEGAEQTS